MYNNLCGAYRDTNGPIKKKESFNPYIAYIKDHEGAEFIPYNYNHQG